MKATIEYDKDFPNTWRVEIDYDRSLWKPAFFVNSIDELKHTVANIFESEVQRVQD